MNREGWTLTHAVRCEFCVLPQDVAPAPGRTDAVDEAAALVEGGMFSSQVCLLGIFGGFPARPESLSSRRVFAD